MIRNLVKPLLFTLITTALATTASAARPQQPDLMIFGATPAGIAAAIEAAAAKRTVMLVEPTARIGGMITHGLSHSDFHSFESLHGPFLHFSQRVLNRYESEYGKDSPQAKASWRGTHGEPSVNLRVFREMLAEYPRIQIRTSHHLASVKRMGDRITAVLLSGPDQKSLEVEAGIFIDASYEGDLLAAADVPYRIGREARAEYGESLAPEKADRQLQGYNYRLCMTQDPNNRVPIPAPANYDRNNYAAIVPLVESGRIPSAFGYPGNKFLLKAHLPNLPNGKRDINDVSRGLVRLSLPSINDNYPVADAAARRRIEKEHLDWQLGLIHFTQTDAALPRSFRDEASTWGLCRDEFADTDHLPPQIYVREARRMVGSRVYTQSDTAYASNDARAKLHVNAIAFGEYSHNCHGTGHEGPRIGGRHTGEFYLGVAPYQIPYGVLLPQRVTNLLVPVACSSSHVGFSALRLEPIWMSLGGAAGSAAALALESKTRVQDVDIPTLQRRIWSRSGATIHVSDVAPGHPDFVAVQWWGAHGGLHGLEPPRSKPGARGRHIVSQYYEAFPGHAAHLHAPLQKELAHRWRSLAQKLKLPLDKLPSSEQNATRGDWIRAAYKLQQDR